MRSVKFASGYAPAESRLVHVLWLTSGLGCDGDSVAMTSATSPSLEDLWRGVMPGTPRLAIYNPLLAYETGEEFMTAFREAAAGRLDPFVLVLEGSVANEALSGDGYWSAFGMDPASGEPVTTDEWLQRLTPRAAAVLALGTCAAYGGVPAMRGNPTGAMGLRDRLGRGWRSRLGLPIVNLPGCPVVPDNITETLLVLAQFAAGTAPAPELDEQGRPAWLFARTVQQSCGRAGFAEQGEYASSFGLRARVPGQARLQGPGQPVQRAAARLDGRHRRLSQRRRHLHRLHDARVPGPVHAVRRAQRRRAGSRASAAVHLRAAAGAPAPARGLAGFRPRAGVAASGGAAGQRL